MRAILFVGLVVVGLMVGALWMAEFGFGPVMITKEYEYRVVLRFGSPVKTITEPGFWYRIPLLDEVITYDARLQYLNAEPLEMVISGGQKLIIDYYAVWRISDPRVFRERFPLGEDAAETRVQETINALVGSKIGRLTLPELLARPDILHLLAEESTEKLDRAGIAVADVRINRTELPIEAEPAAFEQMREQRRAMSREIRAAGQRLARETRAVAHREARTTVAEAHAKSERLRGEGDAESARIYAEAYNQDPEFYAFVRSLEAYRKSIGERTTMVLAPDHEFFRFLQPERSFARDKAAAASAPPPSEPQAPPSEPPPPPTPSEPQAAAP